MNEFAVFGFIVAMLVAAVFALGYLVGYIAGENTADMFVKSDWFEELEEL